MMSDPKAIKRRDVCQILGQTKVAGTLHGMEVFPPEVLLKCLRAYTLFVTSRRATAVDPAALQHSASEQVLGPLMAALAGKLPELPARGAARGLSCLASLLEAGVQLDEGPRLLAEAGVQLEERPGLLAAATVELGRRLEELRLRDIAYSLKALAVLGRHGLFQGPGAAELLGQLYREVQRHVPSMTLEDALMMTKAAAALAPLRRPTEVEEL